MAMSTNDAKKEKALALWTDQELRDFLPAVSQYVIYSYNDVINEIERRRAKREAAKTFWLSVVAVAVAGLSLLASVLVALLK